MSYTRPHALGDLAADLLAIAQKAGTVAGPAVASVAAIAKDPALPEVLCRVQQLTAIENRKPVTACKPMPAGARGGVGLRKVVVPLRAVVYAERNPWVKPAAVAAVVGVPMLIGYLLGRAS